MSLLDDQDNAVDTASSKDRRHSLSTSAHQRLAAALLADSYAFARVVAGHKDLVPAVHMPISYMACGLTDLLIETLDMPNLAGYVQRKLREEFRRRLNGVPWTTPEGRKIVDGLLNGDKTRPALINLRMSRRFFKSSVVTHAGVLYMATVDPNETIKITHAVDPKAEEFCEQIGRTILSDRYRELFPDRFPLNPKRDVSMHRITLAGRTISHPQTCIQASGYLTKEESAHYSIMLNDDLVTDLNSSPDALRDVMKYLKRRTGYFMPTKRIRLLEVGTKHDEEDDDTLFTTGKMSEECLTLRVPIEEHKTRLVNIMERGTPTCPELFPVEKINAEQIQVLTGDEDEDGYKVWFNQYLLSATGGNLRLFPAEVVDDPDRWWMGPFDHPNNNWARRGHYLVARYRRDRGGNPVGHTKCRSMACPGVWNQKSGELRDDWREHADIISFDPWAEFDRAMLVDPAWTDREHSDNWAVSVVGQDNEPIPVRYQLNTLSDSNGMEGWLNAIQYLDERYNPRVIGIDATATQDPMIENMLKTDKRLRRYQSRLVKIHHSTPKSKASRLQEGVAQPLNNYKFLLAPPYRDVNGADAFGGTMTRAELKMIKSTPRQIVRTDQDGIADSLSMAPAVLRASRRRTLIAPEDQRPTAVARRVHPILGLPLR